MAKIWLTMALLASCTTSYDISLNAHDGVFGSLGVTYQVDVSANSDLAGVAITLSSLPTTIVVSPATTTIDHDGRALAYALVPYGVSGTVVASSALATTAEAKLSAAPLTVCPPSFAPAMQASATARVYAVSVKLVKDGNCGNGEAASAGIPVTLVVSPPTGTPTSAMLSTDSSGTAQLSIPVPWGATVVVTATGASGSSSASITGESHPARVECLEWKKVQGIYQVDAHVSSTSVALPSVPVRFSIVSPTGMVGSVSPVEPTTNGDGVASTFVTLNSGVTLPAVVQAVSATSALTIELDTSTASAACP